MEKWEAKVSTKLKTTKPHQIWPLFKDFFNLHKYFPTLSTSYGVHGTNGVPGCVRYCHGSSIKPSQQRHCSAGAGAEAEAAKTSVSWSKERLTDVDEANMSLSYEIVESNIGFKSYVSTVRIIGPVVEEDGQGCVIEWGFSVEPVEGIRFEDLVAMYQVGLQNMVKAMQESIEIVEGSLGK